MESHGDLGKIRDFTDLPLIATNRRKDQGGLSILEESNRLQKITDSIELGFNYADIEIITPDLAEIRTRIHDLGGKLILSHHDFQKTPSIKCINEIKNRMMNQSADVCKIIGTSNTIEDNLTYLSLYKSKGDEGLVSFGMGSNGILSRVLSTMIGAEFTYASTHIGAESAPGQLTLAQMRQLYKLLGV
jgi:3-dehydroquinate dehydratase type I